MYTIESTSHSPQSTFPLSWVNSGAQRHHFEPMLVAFAHCFRHESNFLIYYPPCRIITYDQKYPSQVSDVAYFIVQNQTQTSYSISFLMKSKLFLKALSGSLITSALPQCLQYSYIEYNSHRKKDISIFKCFQVTQSNAEISFRAKHVHKMYFRFHREQFLSVCLYSFILDGTMCVVLQRTSAWESLC